MKQDDETFFSESNYGDPELPFPSFTFARINPYNFTNGTIFALPNLNEIEIEDEVSHNPAGILASTSYLCDSVLDSIPKSNEQPTSFCSQSSLWLKFKKSFEERILSTSCPESMSVLAVGAQGSGKSHTLFGDCLTPGSEEIGLIPRFFDYIYSKDCPLNHLGDRCGKKVELQPLWRGKFRIRIEMSMYLVVDENIIDLFNPPSLYNGSSNVAYSSSVGPTLLNITSPTVWTAAQATELLILGLKAANILLANSMDFLSPANLVVSTKVIMPSLNKFNKVDFVEVACLATPDTAPTSIDHLAHYGKTNISARDIRHNARRELETLETLIQGESPIFKKSVLVYLLQDSFVKHRNCIVFGCLRGSKASFEENEACLSFMTALDVDNTNAEDMAAQAVITGSMSTRSLDMTSGPNSSITDAILRLEDEIRELRLKADDLKSMGADIEVGLLEAWMEAQISGQKYVPSAGSILSGKTTTSQPPQVEYDPASGDITQSMKYAQMAFYYERKIDRLQFIKDVFKLHMAGDDDLLHKKVNYRPAPVTEIAGLSTIEEEAQGIFYMGDELQQPQPEENLSVFEYLCAWLEERGVVTAGTITALSPEIISSDSFFEPYKVVAPGGQESVSVPATAAGHHTGNNQHQSHRDSLHDQDYHSGRRVSDDSQVIAMHPPDHHTVYRPVSQQDTSRSNGNGENESRPGTSGGAARPDTGTTSRSRPKTAEEAADADRIEELLNGPYLLMMSKTGASLGGHGLSKIVLQKGFTVVRGSTVPLLMWDDSAVPQKGYLDKTVSVKLLDRALDNRGPSNPNANQRFSNYKFEGGGNPDEDSDDERRKKKQQEEEEAEDADEVQTQHSIRSWAEVRNKQRDQDDQITKQTWQRFLREEGENEERVFNSSLMSLLRDDKFDRELMQSGMLSNPSSQPTTAQSNRAHSRLSTPGTGLGFSPPGTAGFSSKPGTAKSRRGGPPRPTTANMPCIFMNGPNMRPLHCLFFREGDDVVRVRPYIPDAIFGMEMGDEGPATVFVNGRLISADTTLQDGDVVQLGSSRLLSVRIPLKKKATADENSRFNYSAAGWQGYKPGQGLGPQGSSSNNNDNEQYVLGSVGWDDPCVTDWEGALLKAYGADLWKSTVAGECDRRMAMHLTVNRELAAIAHASEKSPLMEMSEFEPRPDETVSLLAAFSQIDRARFCYLIALSKQSQEWSVEMKRDVTVSFHMRVLGEGFGVKDEIGHHHGRLVKIKAPPIMPKRWLESQNEYGNQREYYTTGTNGSRPESAAKSAATATGTATATGSSVASSGQASRPTTPAQVTQTNSNPPTATAASNPPTSSSVRIFDNSPEPRRLSLGVHLLAAEATEERTYCGMILGNSEAGSGKWWWSSDIFLERMSLMRQMRRLFDSIHCRREPVLIERKYPPNKCVDPYIDTPQDELVGVAFLYLDGLQYMLDVQDTLPLMGYTGRKTGVMKVHVRSWIDRIETIPDYISVDRECKLEEFVGRTCVMNFYFDNLIEIPQHLCASVYISFKFFYHAVPYTTARYTGMTVTPYLNTTVRIEQKITKDFLDFVRTGSIELEVFAKRRTPIQPLLPEPTHLVGEPPDIGNKRLSTADLRPKTRSQEHQFDKMRKKLEAATKKLHTTEKQLKRAKKAVDASQTDDLDNVEAERTSLAERVRELEATVADERERMKNIRSTLQCTERDAQEREKQLRDALEAERRASLRSDKKDSSFRGMVKKISESFKGRSSRKIVVTAIEEGNEKSKAVTASENGCVLS